MVSINNAKQVLNLFTSAVGQRFVQRPNAMRVLASDLRYIPQTEGDVLVNTIKKSVETFIKADKKLFCWTKRKPALSMTEINPESLVLVHRTNYYPNGGKILSTSDAAKTADGITEYRPTVHLALNKSVTEHNIGNEWNTMKYSIIMPFKETVDSMPTSKIIGGIQDDFFFFGSIKLPKGSIILKHNSDIPKDQLKVSEVFDGIRLVETSSVDMVKTTDLMIEKMGYTPYNKALQKHLGATTEDMKLITSEPEATLMNRFEKYEGDTAGKKFIEELLKDDKKNPMVATDVLNAWKQQLKERNLADKYCRKMRDFPNAWSKFCNQYNYFQGLHQGTSWAKCEWTFHLLNLLGKNSKHSWIFGKTDTKACLLQILKDAKTKLPTDKELGFDIDKLTDIIKNSKTPEIAQKEILQKLKIRPTPIPDRSSQYKKIGYDDETIALMKEEAENMDEFYFMMLLSFV